ncbi:hypothetical protein ACEN19_11130 [Corynebacterium auriscanis]|uniref:hypothetical protein n=1 Tax=Corynebacterium auriscanis TaxID=99807 RepID=UPI003CFBC079
MSDINPVEVEQRILELTNRIARGIKVFRDRYDKALETDRDHELRIARAYLKSEGSIEDKKKQAIVECFESRVKRDVAEVAFKEADKLLKALELELRALQSIGASLREQYRVAGRGET